MTRLIRLTLTLGIASFVGCGSDDEEVVVPTATATRFATHTASPSQPPSPSLTPVPTATHTATVGASGTPTATLTPTLTATPTPSATRTMTHGDGCCGDQITDAIQRETCDDGNNVGGDGCAANCTLERELALPLQVHTVLQTVLFALTLDFTSEQLARAGAPDGGSPCGATLRFDTNDIPLALRADDISFAPAVVPGLVCACVRAVALRRCGPALINSRSASCDVGLDCSGDAGICGNPAECNAVHGEGNAAAGVIGCGGLDDIDFGVVADDQTKQFTCVRSGGFAPVGSAFLYTSTAIGTIMDSGTCSIDESDPRKGPDGIPCSDDDPEESRGVPTTSPLTTGTAGGSVDGPVSIASGINCGAAPCITGATGAVFSCEGLAAEPPSPGPFRLCTAFAQLDQVSVGDSVATTCFERR